MKQSKKEQQQTKEADFNKIAEVVTGMNNARMPDVDAEWNEFEKRIDKSEDKKIIPLFTKVRVIAVCAACILILIAGSYSYLIFKENTYSTTSAMVTKVLKDGSEVIMNKNSSIRYNAGYGIINRKIELSGEAFFKVKKGKNQPFVVYTSAAKVRVTGTQFNVKARRRKTEVGVSEGRVEFFSTTISGSKVILTKGLFSSCIENDLPTQAISIMFPEIPEWINNQMSYHGTTVNEIVLDIEDLYNIKIIVPDKNVLTLEVTGIINGETPEDVMQTLGLLVGKQVRTNNNVYELY